MKCLKILGVAALAAGTALPAFAQMAAPSPSMFVMKAGASDTFEISEAKLMTGSANPKIRQFAQQMMTDHMKSTAMVKSAAKADGMMPKPPMMTAMQRSDLAKLTAAKGSKRDMLYISQQKPAHQQALDLMQSYASSGSATHLKDAAGQIVPVVQSHLDMLNQMPSM